MADFNYLTRLDVLNKNYDSCDDKNVEEKINNCSIPFLQARNETDRICLNETGNSRYVNSWTQQEHHNFDR